MSDLTLKANEEGFVVCPVCGEELRGSGVEYFSGAVIRLGEDNASYEYTTCNIDVEGSDLDELYCPACPWSLGLYKLGLYKNVAVKVSK